MPISDPNSPSDGLSVAALRGRRRRLKTQAVALAAARSLLVDGGGWGSVTHAAVAEASGLGRTTIYRLWPDPGDLLYDVIDLDLPSESLPHTGEARDDLLRELMQVRDRLENPESSRLIMAVTERAVHDPLFAALRDRWHRSGTQGTRAVLSRARRDGVIDFPFDLQDGIDELAGPLIVRSLFAGRRISDAYVRRVVERFLRRYRREGRVEISSNK